MSDSNDAQVSSNKGRTNGKKRKNQGEPEAEGAAKKPKKEPSTSATGFLWNGDFVHEAKFACVNCRRGHRAQSCRDALKGVPVQHVVPAGRPGKDVVKVPFKCDCGPVSCKCRHESYLLEEEWVMVDGELQKKLKIAGLVYSNNRCERVGPVTSMVTGSAPYAMGAYQGDGTDGALNMQYPM